MNIQKRPRSRHSGLTYWKHAMLHPWHLMGIALSTLTGFLLCSVLLGLGVLITMELLVLTTIHRLRSFQRHVDSIIKEKQQAAAAKARSALLSKMNDGHREELESLEKLVDRIRAHIGWRADGASPAPDDCLGLGQLIASYAGIAIAHQANKEHLDLVARKSLEREISAVSASRPLASARVGAIMDRRLTLLRRRLERWDSARDELEAMAQKLAMIGDGVRLIHEHLEAAIAARSADEPIEEVIAGLVNEEIGLGDFAVVAEAHQGVDPEVLELGRGPAAPRAGKSVPELDVTGGSRALTDWYVSGVRPLA